VALYRELLGAGEHAAAPNTGMPVGAYGSRS